MDLAAVKNSGLGSHNVDKAVRTRIQLDFLGSHTDSDPRPYPAPGTFHHTAGSVQVLELVTMAQRSAFSVVNTKCRIPPTGGAGGPSNSGSCVRSVSCCSWYP